METVSKRNFIKGKKVTVSIRLPEELKKVLDSIADDSGRTFSEFVQDGLDQWAYLHKSSAKKK